MWPVFLHLENKNIVQTSVLSIFERKQDDLTKEFEKLRHWKFSAVTCNRGINRLEKYRGKLLYSCLLHIMQTRKRSKTVMLPLQRTFSRSGSSMELLVGPKGTLSNPPSAGTADGLTAFVQHSRVT